MGSEMCIRDRTKARNKIRQVLGEMEYKKASEGKELLSRRLKNWKLEFPDDYMSELMKKLKYPTVNSFFAAIGEGTLDIDIVKNYILEHEEMEARAIEAARAADQAAAAASKSQWEGSSAAGDDILVINAKDLKGLDYNPLLQPGIRRRCFRLRDEDGRHQDSPHVLPERSQASGNVPLPDSEGEMGRHPFKRHIHHRPEGHHRHRTVRYQSDNGHREHLQGFPPPVQRQ